MTLTARDRIPPLNFVMEAIEDRENNVFEPLSSDMKTTIVKTCERLQSTINKLITDNISLRKEIDNLKAEVGRLQKEE